MKTYRCFNTIGILKRDVGFYFYRLRAMRTYTLYFGIKFTLLRAEIQVILFGQLR